MPANDRNKALVNDNIRFSTVMLIGPQGEKMGVKSIYEAKRIAEGYNLDLYCVAPSNNPPVCKILDYGKFRFDNLKKEKENRKNQKTVELKEMRMSPVIADHDLETKARSVIKWLEQGNKVKLTVRFRGRQITHAEIGESVMNRLIAMCDEVGVVDKKPLLENRFLVAFLAPKKK